MLFLLWKYIEILSVTWPFKLSQGLPINLWHICRFWAEASSFSCKFRKSLSQSQSSLRSRKFLLWMFHWESLEVTSASLPVKILDWMCWRVWLQMGVTRTPPKNRSSRTSLISDQLCISISQSQILNSFQPGPKVTPDSQDVLFQAVDCEKCPSFHGSPMPYHPSYKTLSVTFWDNPHSGKLSTRSKADRQLPWVACLEQFSL